MATTLKIDQDGAIRALETKGFGSAEAASIVHVVHDFLVVPAAENMVTKAAERSARSRFRQRIDTAFEQVSDLVARVSRLEADMAEVKSRFGSVESRLGSVESRLSDVTSRLDRVEESIKGLRDLML